MLYCEKCKTAFDGDLCPVCGSRKKTRPVREDDLCRLKEIDMIWSEVAEDVLKENGIPYLIKGRLGAGLAVYVGQMFEKNIFYVPYEKLEEARELTERIFAETQEDPAEPADPEESAEPEEPEEEKDEE